MTRYYQLPLRFRCATNDGESTAEITGDNGTVFIVLDEKVKG